MHIPGYAPELTDDGIQFCYKEIQQCLIDVSCQQIPLHKDLCIQTIMNSTVLCICLRSRDHSCLHQSNEVEMLLFLGLQEKF